MDAVKEEISMRMLCNACLCIGNTLYQVTNEKLKRYYLSALNEIPLCNMPAMSPVVCLDCSTLLKKSYNFREQVKDSYRILMTYTSENLNECLLTDVSRPPRLKMEKNDCIDIEPESNGTPNSIADGCIEEKLKTSSSKDEMATNDQHKSQKNEKFVVSPKHSPNNCGIEYRDTHVFVKEELKFEDCDSDGDYDIPLVDLKQYDSLAEMKDSQPNITSCEQSEQLLDRTRKEQKTSKKNGKVKKKKNKNDEDIPNILTIHMTYEEMMEERQKELERESYMNAEFKCDTCIVGFTCNKSYKKHLQNRHSASIGKYSCPICKTISATVESFSTHYKRHMKRYECGICHARTADVKSIRQHYYSSHRISLKQYKCPDCGKVSNTADAHRYHADTHKSRVPCADCDKTFRHRGGLLNHRLTVHEAKNKFPCTLCGKVFRWKNSLKRHMPVHDNKGGAGAGAWCARCAVSFASVASYRRHLANSLRHVTKDHFRFICDHCNGRFADKTKLRDHIEEKHLHKTYTCKICLKRFQNRVNMEQHTRNVHRGRPNNNMCHHCGKGFPTKAQLESHMRTHTGERPYICEYCPTTFSQHSNLYKHNRQVHLNMKSKRYPSGKKSRENQITLPLEPTQIPIDYPVDIQFTL